MPAIASRRAVVDLPVYWFARLEKAVDEGDHQTAAEAQRQLARLGVRVNFCRRGLTDGDQEDHCPPSVAEVAHA